jgi:3'-5' exonuclease
MATLIFDIETVGENWDSLDATTQSVLSRWIDRTADTSERRDAQLKDLKEGLGFSPLTGAIVAIGLYDLERGRGVVYYDAKGKDVEDIEDGNFIFKARSESEMLADFWDGAQSYDTFVTFNGRGFDVPFLMLRSVVHRLTPTRDLMEGRYLYQQRDTQHIDLADQLSFYGAVHRRNPLHLYCRAFGIESPKGEVSGDDVAGLYEAGQTLDIARYNAKDVTATTELYRLWYTHLSPESQTP